MSSLFEYCIQKFLKGRYFFPKIAFRMEIAEYSDTMKEIQEHILDVMANELNSNEYIAKYDINVIQQIIQEKKHYLIDILHKKLFNSI